MRHESVWNLQSLGSTFLVPKMTADQMRVRVLQNKIILVLSCPLIFVVQDLVIRCDHISKKFRSGKPAWSLVMSVSVPGTHGFRHSKNSQLGSFGK